MNIHKHTRLTLLDRKEIWQLYQTRRRKVTGLAEHFRVSRPTIYAALKRARLQEFVPRNSANQRFKTVRHGLKRPAKAEQAIQERLKREARRHNKSYPGELAHFDTKRLPPLKGQSPTQARECLFVAIDGFSRELCADILPDKAQGSAAQFLVGNVIAQCPYQVDYAYSDNGKEHKGGRPTCLCQGLQKPRHRPKVHQGQPAPDQRQGRTGHSYTHGNVAWSN